MWSGFWSISPTGADFHGKPGEGGNLGDKDSAISSSFVSIRHESSYNLESLILICRSLYYYYFDSIFCIPIILQALGLGRLNWCMLLNYVESWFLGSDRSPLIGG